MSSGSFEHQLLASEASALRELQRDMTVLIAETPEGDTLDSLLEANTIFSQALVEAMTELRAQEPARERLSGARVSSGGK